MPLRRYICPHCSGGLSRTAFHPEWLSLEAKDPEFRMPLRPVLLAIVFIGLGLGFIHPGFGFLGVALIIYWLNWRYYSYLQCDDCSRFYFGGQLGGSLRETRPWTRRELRNLALKVAVVGAVLLAIFVPLRLVEWVTQQNCSVECAQGQMVGEVFLNQCKCLPKQ